MANSFQEMVPMHFGLNILDPIIAGAKSLVQCTVESFHYLVRDPPKTLPSQPDVVFHMVTDYVDLVRDADVMGHVKDFVFF